MGTISPDTWTIRIHRNALQSLYRLPRGEAAAASSLIASLQEGRIPEDAHPIEQGSRVYKYSSGGYQIIFEIDESARILRILGLRSIE